MFTIIYNPVAGGGKAKRALPAIEAELKRRNIEYRALETADHSDKAHYADAACSNGDSVCIVGGDGTALDILNQLPERHMRLIIVPCGTGNDFIKCVGLGKNPLKTFIAQLDAKPRKLDHAKANGEYFLNVFGLGFDVEVLKKLDEFKTKHTGLKAYLMALIKAIKEYKPRECELSVDGGEFRKTSVSILSVGNGQYIGGGMKAVPNGNPFDGALNVVEVRPVKKRNLLVLLPTFILGIHTKVGIAKTYPCKTLHIRGKNISYQMDGEIRQADEIKLELINGEITFGA